MRVIFNVAAIAGALAVIGILLVFGGIVGGLIGLQNPDLVGALAPELNGGIRGAYAGLVAAASLALPLGIFTVLTVRHWARRGQSS